ncbi:uncharacterized protein LOC135081994 [Ostrinia nubilalis]|uniref:uncharacterized protein LOC135081994 n=1 Tax=Ostrinia nubilalis TaxID=29057 RepID=UPI0030825F88
MESLKDTKIIKFHPDTLEAIRKLYGLDQPGAINDAIDILQEWTKKQDHFMKKDFSREFLERLLIRSKGSVERSKQTLDKLCTAKTLMSKFFANCNVKELTHLEIVEDVILPRLTSDYYRVYLLRNVGQEFEYEFYTNYFRRLVYLLEYEYINDYVAGVVAIFDFRQINLGAHLRKLSFVDLQQFLTMAMECYGFRIKGIHFISTSKLVEALVAMFKQILSGKVASRIYVHNSLESLHEHVEKDVLPKDYGGDEMTLTEIHQLKLDTLTTEEFMDYMKMMNAAGTNEAYRQADKYNEQVMGMPGSFRTLRVD